MPTPVPLTTLLSWSWIAYTIEVDNAFEAAGTERTSRLVRISLPMWTNGLRCIHEDGVTVDELRAAARAACNIGGLERWGWISVGDAGRRRQGYGTSRGLRGDSVLRPTRAGSYARRWWPQLVTRVEERWRAAMGDERIDRLHEALAVTASTSPAMPWSPPEVAPPDGFCTRLIGGAGGASPESPPLVALMGQVLTALTVSHEMRSEVSLPLGANLLRVIGHEPVRLRDLPALSGLSKEGIAMATNYLCRSELAVADPGKVIRLTPAGLDALDSYWHWSAHAVNRPLREALEAVLEQREALSAGLVPPPAGWRNEKPYLAQTQRLLADPTGALPWHPMVLHRGGWPDAS